MNETEDIYSDIRAIYRRLEALETAPRLPQISTIIGGVKYASTDGGVLTGTADGAMGDLDDAGNTAEYGPYITLPAADRGGARNILVLYGCKTSANSLDSFQCAPTVYMGSTNSYPHLIKNSLSTFGDETLAIAVLYPVYDLDHEDLTFYLEYGGTTTGQMAVIDDPWIMTVPL